MARVTVENPEPSKYKLEGNMAKSFKSASLKKID